MESDFLREIIQDIQSRQPLFKTHRTNRLVSKQRSRDFYSK